MILGVEGIKKTILYGGTGAKPKFVTGTKVQPDIWVKDKYRFGVRIKLHLRK